MKKCKNCGNKFKQFKSTDKYCSPKCAYSNYKPIAKLSKKRKKENNLYLIEREKFLLLPENKYCIVAKIMLNKTIETTEIHHKAGRVGELLNYKKNWLAVSREGHNWIHANPLSAYQFNYLIPSTQIKKISKK